MKKLLLLPIIAFACGISLPAQTLKIFHKSHAGTAASFSAGDFDVFGISPEMIQAQEEAARKREEEAKRKEEEAKRLKKENRKVEREQRKEEKQNEKVEERDARGSEDTPVTDPPVQEQVAPAAPPAPVAPKAPVKAKQNNARQTAAAPSSSAVAEAVSDFVEAPAAPKPVTLHEEASQRRMGWLYGIVGLTIVPTLMVASGAFSRRKSEHDQA